MIKLDKVDFSYSSGDGQNGLRGITLAIEPGECVLLCGESGCGKTTLTRIINGLIPHFYEGELSGSVKIGNSEVSKIPLYETAALVGSVFQNPRSQFFNTDTTSEMVFACENLGVGRELIEKRVLACEQELGLTDILGKSIFALSGGQKQKIACASVSVLDPPIMVLDEPSSNLDMPSIDELRRVMRSWKARGKTIIIAEHRLFYLRDLVDRIIYLKKGRIRRCFTPQELTDIGSDTLRELGLRPFDFGSIGHRSHPTRQPSKNDGNAAFPVTCGADTDFHLADEPEIRKPDAMEPDTAGGTGRGIPDMADGSIPAITGGNVPAMSDGNVPAMSDGNIPAMSDGNVPAILVDRLVFAYGKKHPVLSLNRIDIDQGGIVALVGPNGAGKSTFARCLCGLEKEAAGTLSLFGKPARAKERLRRCYLVMQDVNHQLFTESVLDEIRISMPEENEGHAEELLSELGLLPNKELHPMILSGGQKQRVAIASALASGREIIIFDEPTSGLDANHMHEVADSMKRLRDRGKTQLVITHDPELILACCTQVVEFCRGSIADRYPLDGKGRQKLLSFFERGLANGEGAEYDAKADYVA